MYDQQCPGYDKEQETVCFQGHKCVLSNMFPCRIIYKEETFSSSEHLYQYLKAKALGREDLAQKIKEAGTGYEAKGLSKQLKG